MFLPLEKKTDRVLKLTEEAIGLNAANYTVWQYRREVIQALGIPNVLSAEGLNQKFQEEFKFSLSMIDENPKNYQVWHHRKILVSWAAGYDEETGKISPQCENHGQDLLEQELELTALLIEKDVKNYHAWQHRQWLLTTFSNYSGEIEFISTLLNEDVRNNSAWNQRYFVVVNSKNITAKMLNDEMEYAWNQILKARSNESAWNYLRGLIDLKSDLDVPFYKEIPDKFQELFSSAGVRSIPMLALMLDLIDEDLARGSESDKKYKQALEICDLLSEQIDTIRKSYWAYLKNRMVDSYSARFST